MTNSQRPPIPNYVPDVYRALIEKCWSHEPQNRPTFDKIVKLLRTNDDFTSTIQDKEDFLDFVEYIDNCKTAFESNKQIIPIDKFIKRKSKTFQKISIKNDRPKQKKRPIFPLKEYTKLSQECKEKVNEAEYDPEMQFEIGFCLIEGEQNFPVKTEIGIKYLEKSISNENVDAAVYYSRMLIKADRIPRDLSKAESILNQFSIEDSSEIPLLLGLIKKKQKDFTNSFRFFEISSRVGNGESQYEHAKLLYKGKGCNENKKEAMKLFLMAKKNGFNKSDKFLYRQQIEREEKQSTRISEKKP